MTPRRPWTSLLTLVAVFIVALSNINPAAAAATAPVAAAAAAAVAVPCPVGIAHRGNAAGAPENSLNALRASFAAGATWVESDVQFTSDSVPVIMHDATVDRMTNGTGSIAGMTAARFTALTFSDGQHPPTLDQLLAVVTAASNRHLLLEIKPTGLSAAREQILLGKLRGLESRVHLMAFAAPFPAVQHLKTADPALTTNILGYDPILPPPTGIVSENLEYTYLTAARVSDLHYRGQQVKAWTVNDATNWARLRQWGVDAIITNKITEYLQWAATTCPSSTPPASHEYVTNKSVETDLTGWTGLWSANSATTRLSGGYDGSYAIRSVNNSSSAAQHGFTSSPETLDGTTNATAAGKAYTASLWVKPDVAGQKLNLYVRERNASGATVGSKTAVLTTVAGWQQLTTTYAAVASGSRISLTAWSSSSAAGKGFTADLLSFTTSS